jgi:endo-1,4-beta-D-glucanase Y
MNPRMPGHRATRGYVLRFPSTTRRPLRSRCLLLLVILLLVGTTGGCKQGPWAMWNAYASHFIDGHGRVVDPQGGGRTTSEGQSYALFFALANNDREHFDQVLKWTQANLAGGSLSAHLPAWLWGKSKEGEWKTLDPNPAADSDAWIAYSLVEAGRLWHVDAQSELCAAIYLSAVRGD